MLSPYTIRSYNGLFLFAIHAIFRGLLVIENNCINNLHYLIIFDLISLRLREALTIYERDYMQSYTFKNHNIYKIRGRALNDQGLACDVYEIKYHARKPSEAKAKAWNYFRYLGLNVPILSIEQVNTY